MSKRLDVLTAVKALVAAALPDAEVLGLDGDEAAPDRISAGGRVIVRSGTPGDPEVDLSPLTYHYEPEIPIEVASSTGDEDTLDAMTGAIGRAVQADRTLGGLVDWLDATAPLTDDVYLAGATPARGAVLSIIAAYSTSDPLN
jgi:hypothetical protein